MQRKPYDPVVGRFQWPHPPPPDQGLRAELWDDFLSCHPEKAAESAPTGMPATAPWTPVVVLTE